MKRKRSQEKRMTRQCQVIRFMRMSKRISQRKAAHACGVSEQAIGHYENGRMEVAPDRLKQFLTTYGYSRSEFDEYLNGKPLPVLNIRDECGQIVGKIPDSKLQMLHAVLLSFLA